MTKTVAAWPRRAAITAAVACLTVAGCGGDIDADPQDSGLPSKATSPASTEATKTSDPADTPPPEPANIDNTSPAAAKSFARYVVDLINYSNTTLDLGPFRAVVGSTCEVCRAALESAERLANEGNVRVEGGKWTVGYLRYVPGRPRDEPLIDIVIKGASGRIFHPGEEKPEVNPAFRRDFLWHLNYSKTIGWRLIDWEEVG
jgi:hypothetical protein